MHKRLYEEDGENGEEDEKRLIRLMIPMTAAERTTAMTEKTTEITSRFSEGEETMTEKRRTTNNGCGI